LFHRYPDGPRQERHFHLVLRAEHQPGDTPLVPAPLPGVFDEVLVFAEVAVGDGAAGAAARSGRLQEPAGGGLGLVDRPLGLVASRSMLEMTRSSMREKSYQRWAVSTLLTPALRSSQMNHAVSGE
jgi:hypothetical protein